MAAGNVKALTFMDWYLPGFRAGGPVKTLASMTAQLAGHVDFFIATRDRDLGEARPYPAIQPGRFQAVGNAQVRYLSKTEVSPWGIAGVCRSTPHDVVYLNSTFSRLAIWYLMCRRLGAVPRRPVVLAPRGEFAPGALGLRAGLKQGYLAAAGRLGAFDRILWQASAEHERLDIEAALLRFGALKTSMGIAIAPDLLDLGSGGTPFSVKQPGEVRFLFLSRISPMKNLRTAIRLVGRLRGRIFLEVYGPVGDEAYWKECRLEADGLPSNVRFQAHGPVVPAEVPGVMARHDFLLLPTLGENFGHVVAESLAAATPVVLSDRTSWTSLESRGAGWSIPLEDEQRWGDVLQTCVDMANERHSGMRAAARSAVLELAGTSVAIDLNRELLRRACGHS
jgi:glycosyltransferase involved in cell wall biosynthesis